jgi:tetratricopeptide (TPR) repeat protein
MDQNQRKMIEDVLLDGLTTSTGALEASSIAHCLWPEDLFWAAQYAQAMEMVGKYAEAEAILKAYYRGTNKTRYRVHITFARLAERQNMSVEAENWFRSAVDLNPDSTAPVVYLAGFLARHARFNESIILIEEALKRNLTGDVEELLLNLAKSKRTVGDLAGARESCLKAIAIDPKYQEAIAFLESIEIAFQIRRDVARLLGEEWKTIEGAKAGRAGETRITGGTPLN